jgi:hypothetical protein
MTLNSTIESGLWVETWECPNTFTAQTRVVFRFGPPHPAVAGDPKTENAQVRLLGYTVVLDSD